MDHFMQFFLNFAKQYIEKSQSYFLCVGLCKSRKRNITNKCEVIAYTIVHYNTTTVVQYSIYCAVVHCVLYYSVL